MAIGLPAYLDAIDLSGFAGEMSGVGVVRRWTPAGAVDVFASGEPGRPVVVLLPPYGMSYLLLAGLAKRLSRRFRVLSWETRGCPDAWSGEGASFMTLSQEAERLLAIVTEEGHADVHFVGWCQAAQLCVHAIARHGFAPRTVAWIAPSGLSTPSVQSEFERCALPVYRQIERMGASQAGKLAEILDRYHGQPLSGDHVGEKLTMLHLADPDMTHLFSRYMRRYVDNIELVQADLPEAMRVGQYLVLHGKDDTFSHYSGSVRLARRFRSVQLDLVDSGGHLRLFYEPEEVVKSIESFIGQFCDYINYRQVASTHEDYIPQQH